MVEPSLSHQPETFFKKKHTIKDQHGVDRVLDLYVSTKVNGKTFLYAFECKHYKKGVGLKDIIDFHAMIDNKGISGYFVTSGSFQAGAIKKAAALNIQLLTLKKRAPSNEDIAGIFLYRKKYEIANVSFFGKSSDFDNESIQKLFASCEGCKKGLSNIFNNMIIPTISPLVEGAVEQMTSDFTDITKIATTFGVENARKYELIAVHDKGSSISHQRKYKIFITHTTIGLKVWNEKVYSKSIEAEHFMYTDVKNSGSGTLFSKAEFLIEDQKVVICISRPESNSKMQNIIVGKEEIIHEVKPVRATELGSLHQFGFSDLFANGGSSNGKDNCD